jgi:copper chaperone CopZ
MKKNQMNIIIIITKKQNMKNLLLLNLFVLISVFGFSQKAEKFKTIIIQTSAECGDCKERIEGKLNYTSGIKFAELNIESKKLTVKFATSKITEAEIKQIINEIGYDADDQKAKKETVQKLPLCCQPGGMKQ